MTSAPTGIQGGLIGIERDGIVGWAFDPGQPDAPVAIQLVAGGAVIGQAIANQFDDERVRTLVGTGVPGFIARLATAPPAFPARITVQDAAGRALGAALIVHQPAELAHLIGHAPMLTYEGNIDGVYAGALKGWARDTADPDAAVPLELVDTGTVVATTTANVLREDLRHAGLHHGLYGFTFDLPLTLLDGRAHSLQVRVARTKVLLRGGPIAFGPLASSALVAQITELRTEVAELRATIDGLVSPTGAVQRLMLRTLSERVVAQADIQREQTEREMAALRALVFAATDAATPAPATPPSRTRRRT